MRRRRPAALRQSVVLGPASGLRPGIFGPTDSVYNDPALAQRLRRTLATALGGDKVVKGDPITASEDFSVFVEQAIPGFYLTLGGADPQKHTAINAEVAMLRDLLSGGD